MQSYDTIQCKEDTEDLTERMGQCKVQSTCKVTDELHAARRLYYHFSSLTNDCTGCSVIVSNPFCELNLSSKGAKKNASVMYAMTILISKSLVVSSRLFTTYSQILALTPSRTARKGHAGSGIGIK